MAFLWGHPVYEITKTLKKNGLRTLVVSGGILESLVPSFPTCFGNHMEHFNLIQKVSINIPLNKPYLLAVIEYS